MRLRRFLTVLVCLSTLAFAQNVVAGTLISESKQAAFEAERVQSAPNEESAALQVGGEVPETSTMMLLVCGLAGLTAAGGRGRVEDRTKAQA